MVGLGRRYHDRVALAGRRRETEAIQRLLSDAAAGRAALLVIVGAPGAGKSSLAEAAALHAADLGLRVFRGTPMAGMPDRLVWGQLLEDAGEHGAATAILTDPQPLDLDAAALRLARRAGSAIVVDDVDRSGPAGLGFLGILASRLLSAGPAVVVTSRMPLGMGREVQLGPLTADELAQVLPGLRPELVDAVRVAARGMPGPALSLAAEVTDADPTEDVLVHVALRAPSSASFLDIDPGLVGLLESALGRVSGDEARARLLARLGRELLADASATARRRAVVDEALLLARRTGSDALLAEVLDARLHALWDPAGADDRLAAASEIMDLARAAGDDVRERHGLFWRFVALMELGRVSEAESALAAYRRLAEAAGDPAGLVMALSRQAVLAIMRGRFDEAERLVPEVADRAVRAGMPDAERLVASLRGVIAGERDPDSAPAALAWFRSLAARMPGHLMEATAVRILAVTGNLREAEAELERMLPTALRASGPRWLGAASDLAVAAAVTGNVEGCRQLYSVLLPYSGRLVVWAGAVSFAGPVSYYLGLLATRLGRFDEARAHLGEALQLSQHLGALPSVAHCLAALADAAVAAGTQADVRLAEEQRQRARALAESMGMRALLAQLTGPADEWSLRRDGQDWVLDAGDEHARLRDGRGVDHLRALLAWPGREMPALDLAAGGAGLQVADAGPMLDDQARTAYRGRLGRLAEEIEAADRAGDAERAERAHAERRALLDELRRSTGLGGRARRISPEAERARVNVTRAIRSTLQRITAVAPRAGAHLQLSVRTGHVCRYQPAPGGPSRWRL